MAKRRARRQTNGRQSQEQRGRRVVRTTARTDTEFNGFVPGVLKTIGVLTVGAVTIAETIVRQPSWAP